MNPRAIIAKTRDGLPLDRDEIHFFIRGLSRQEIPLYQVSAWLMAAYLQGLGTEETALLTEAMMQSGRVLTFTDPTVVDKHSTGGVGDKTSFICAPLARACGVKVPMIAGRSLAHTGGTIDKIESLSGFQTELSLEDFQERVLQHGFALIGQTQDFAPADKILYSLRDVTATVSSLPLITASIMSKKLASGARGLALDVKTGNGAFLPELTEAQKLAQSLVTTAKSFQRRAQALITDMSQPLGQAVGNALEVIECVQVLSGEGPEDLTELSLKLAATMITLAGIADSTSQAETLARRALKDKSGLQQFKELCTRQGADPRLVEDPTRLPLAPQKTTITSPREGVLHFCDTKMLGYFLVDLGGGRHKTDDPIDHSVGFLFKPQLGQRIEKEQVLLEVYHHPQQQAIVQEWSQKILNQGLSIKKGPMTPPPLIHGEIS